MILDRQENLRADAEVVADKHVEGRRDHPFGRVLHRHDPMISATEVNLFEHITDLRLRQILSTRSELQARRLMSPGHLRAKIRDRHFFFASGRGGHE